MKQENVTKAAPEPQTQMLPCPKFTKNKLINYKNITLVSSYFEIWHLFDKNIIEGLKVLSEDDQEAYSDIIYTLLKCLGYGEDGFDKLAEHLAKLNDTKALRDRLNEWYSNNKPPHSALLNSPSTNTLVGINTAVTKPHKDKNTGAVTVRKSNLTLSFDKFDGLTKEFDVLIKNFQTSTVKLLDICTLHLTRQNGYHDAKYDTLVSFTIDDYMDMRGIKKNKTNKDNIRKKLKFDLEVLYSASIEWSEPDHVRSKGAKNYGKMRILQMQQINDGVIRVRFSEDLAKCLVESSYIMQYPEALLQLDERNGNAYAIGRKLALHNSMENNIKKGTANTISVRALLDYAPDIPAYDAVTRTDAHIRRRIIEPLENALNALEQDGIISWEYRDSNKKALTEEAIKNLDYETFVNTYINFSVLDAPDQTERLKIKTAKKSGTKKPRSKKGQI